MASPRVCTTCSKPIKFTEISPDKWRPVNPDGTSHKCNTSPKQSSISVKLNEPLKTKDIFTLQDGNNSFDCVSSSYIKVTLNQIFGSGNWSEENKKLEIISTYQTEDNQWVAGAVCVRRITYLTPDGLRWKEGSSVGHNADEPVETEFQAIERAQRIAESRALVRAVHSMGWKLGLGLYFPRSERTPAMVT